MSKSREDIVSSMVLPGLESEGKFSQRASSSDGVNLETYLRQDRVNLKSPCWGSKLSI